MKALRERGIYLAPNGESFVASRKRRTTADGKLILSRLGGRLSCFLFRRYAWALSALARGDMRIIGATTLTEYKEFIAEDEALARRFRLVKVVEPTFHGSPDYEVTKAGNLVALKQPLNFRPDQLVDTGMTAGAH